MALDQACLLALSAPQLDGAVEVVGSHLAATAGRTGEHPVVATPGAHQGMDKFLSIWQRIYVPQIICTVFMISDHTPAPPAIEL